MVREMMNNTASSNGNAMPEYKKILESTARIRFHDCDPFGHLNNSRYIDYCLTARGDQLLDEYGFDIYQLAQEQGTGWVAGQTQIAYHDPARLTEAVMIRTQLIAYSARTLLLEASMWDVGLKRAKAVMWARLVHWNVKTQRSHQHTAALMAFFGQIANPLPAGINFEDRVKMVRRRDGHAPGSSK
jgi:YbgC/YbaW family acyl-CoA thioester hydrolase